MGFDDNSNSMDDASFDMTGNDNNGGDDTDFDMSGNDGGVDNDFDMNGNDSGDDTDFDMNGNDGDDDNGKPFEDSNFDMGIEENPDDDPKKFIQGAAAKIASELRKYQESMPTPDMELNKTAVNTVAAATKTNLKPEQETELMQSYSDTMKRNNSDGNNSDNNNDFDMGGDDTENTDFDMNNDGQNMDMNNDDQNMDMNNQNMGDMGMDDQNMDMNQDQSIQECGDIRLNQKKSKSEVAYPKQKNNYTRKPYTNPLKTV